MTNADWWARVVQARTERDDPRPQRIWLLRKDVREAAIDLKAVPGIGARDRAHGGRAAAQDAPVPIPPAGGIGRCDCRHANDVRGEGVGVMVAAVSCRKSTDQSAVADEAKSVTRQLAHARAYAVRKGWTVRGATGA
jgi:hypothetical protein